MAKTKLKLAMELGEAVEGLVEEAKALLQSVSFVEETIERVEKVFEAFDKADEVKPMKGKTAKKVEEEVETESE